MVCKFKILVKCDKIIGFTITLCWEMIILCDYGSLKTVWFSVCLIAENCTGTIDFLLNKKCLVYFVVDGVSSKAEGQQTCTSYKQIFVFLLDEICHLLAKFCYFEFPCLCKWNAWQKKFKKEILSIELD